MLSVLNEGGSPSFPGKANLSAWLCRICCDAGCCDACLFVCLLNRFFLFLFLSMPWLVFGPLFLPSRVQVCDLPFDDTHASQPHHARGAESWLRLAQECVAAIKGCCRKCHG